MGFPTNSRSDARQISILAVALLWAILLLSLAPGAKGEATAHPNVDKDPSGAPYVAGELLVLYEPGTSENTEQAVVRGSGGRTAEDLPGKMRLVTFPGIKQAKPEEARERALQRKLEDLRDDPGIEAADYNHLYKASFKPNDPRFGAQWGLKTAHFPGAWEDARGTGVKIAIVDSGIDKNHPDIGTKIAAQQTFIADMSAPYPIFSSFDHGTHVAGIAATLTNNDKGVAGGCPACKLLIAKVLNANGDTYADNLASGIDWSANNGADVINLSLAGLLASEGKTASEIRQRMQSTATDLGAAGDDPKFGYGRINAKRAVP